MGEYKKDDALEKRGLEAPEIRPTGIVPGGGNTYAISSKDDGLSGAGVWPNDDIGPESEQQSANSISREQLDKLEKKVRTAAAGREDDIALRLSTFELGELRECAEVLLSINLIMYHNMNLLPKQFFNSPEVVTRYQIGLIERMLGIIGGTGSKS